MTGKHQVVRVAVGFPDGPRSSVWRIWAPPPASGKSDVYVAVRSLAGVFKASLHESGVYRSAFTSAFETELGGESHLPKGTRLIDRWPRPSHPGHGTTLAFQILIPTTDLRPMTLLPEDFDQIQWIPTPKDNEIIEIAIVLTAPGVFHSGWPGSRSMGTQLIGSLLLASGETAWVVHRVAADAEAYFTSDLPGLKNRARTNPPTWGSAPTDWTDPRMRAIFFLRRSDGGRAFVDAAID
jgi:hypothetical protein